MSIIRILGLFIASSFFAAHATSAIILSQAPPAPLDGRTSDSAATSGLNQQAQIFTLGADGNVAAVVVWGYYESLPPTPPTDNFTISFYTDDASLPQEPPFRSEAIAPTSREATALIGFGGGIVYKYTFNFASPVPLTASTPYYISVLNNTTNTTRWNWNEIVPKGGPRSHKLAAGTTWSSTTNSLAFELSDTQILPFTVGGDVSGLASGASVVLQNNGADDQTLSVDGSFTFTQQSDGSSYDVTVATQPPGQTCIVADGSGTLSGADVSSVSVSCVDTPAPPAPPAPPTATAGDSQASVTWTKPADGGSTITAYTVTSAPDGKTCTTSNADTLTCDVTGLTNGTAYTFSVTATNGVGNSAASAASSSVTPAAPPVPPVPTVATPVPTSPLWLLGVMAGLLSLVGISKLRKA